MIFRTTIILLTVLITYSCAPQTSKDELQSENNSQNDLTTIAKLKIENGINQGIRANAKLGIKNPIIYTTSIITNDNTIPIHLEMALSKEYEFPAFCGNSTYKVFLFPEELTPDTATLTNTIVSGEDDFLKSPLDSSYTFNKILNPDESCVITIGTLYLGSSNCEVLPRAVFSYANKELYDACDANINKVISTSSQLEIGVKLEFYNQRKFIAPEDHCTIIPCGQISYAKN